MKWRQLLPMWMRHLARAAPLPIPQPLWEEAINPYPFITALPAAERAQLQALSAHFLHHKEFTGVHGVVVTDTMAVGIAAQACLLLLHWGPPAQAIRWFDDFVGIVVHPTEAIAQREWMDDNGIVHTAQESVQGEAMEGGPVMLSWEAVQTAAPPAEGPAFNVVIHEFAHKLDMRDGLADGIPPLPRGFMGHNSAAAARQAWQEIWQEAYTEFGEQVIRHERFGQAAPWLDSYGAEDPAEFFAVVCEAYWVNDAALRTHWPALTRALDAFFLRPQHP